MQRLWNRAILTNHHKRFVRNHQMSCRDTRLIYIDLGIGLFGCLLVLILLGRTGSSIAYALERNGKGLQTEETLATERDESWQVIYVGDARVGYARNVVRPFRVEGRNVLRTENETHITVKRFGQQLSIQTNLRTEETEDGDLLSFVFEMKNPPAGSTRTVGTKRRRLDGLPELELETTIAGRTTKSTLPWDADVKSPAYQDRMLRDVPLKPGDSRTFKTFVPEFSKISTVKFVADDYRLVKLFDGQQRALKVRITQSILPMVTVRAYFDQQGDSLKTETDFLGTTMITYTVPKHVALEAIAGAELDIAVNTLVRVTPIKNAQKTTKVVYRITIPEDDPAQYLIACPTQQIERVAPDTVDLTVTTVVIPENVRSQKTSAEFLAETRYLQCKDLKVVEHARRAAAGLNDPGRIAVSMERYVHDKLTRKNFSTALASAAEVAENLEGDCTEHAVLLAAMLRAQRIPSKIAVGMVYVQSLQSFGGHMWTEALIGGQWIPLDATLGLGGIGADHIKLSESSFSNDAPSPVTTFLPLLSVLGKIKIEVVQSTQ